MKSLPLGAKIYISLVCLSAFLIAVYSAYLSLSVLSLWTVILIVALVIAALDAVPIRVYGSSLEMTISTVSKFASLLLFPIYVPILATFLGTLAAELVSKRPWFKRLFNVSQMTLTWGVVASVYWVVRQPKYDFLDSVQNIAALILAGTMDYITNSILLASVISFAFGISFRYVWLKSFPGAILVDLSMIPMGVFVAILWRFNPLTIPLAALPLFAIRHSYHTANYLQSQTNEALTALMRVIDERDNETFGHSEHVSQLAREIARTLELAPEEMEVIGPAALLHDLGKVGMAGSILFKAGALTEDERLRAQEHAAIGAELLSKFPLFEKGATLVRHHHERYDGKGYPDRLKGEKIPLGARIISVADAFQAMIEDRPYRKALSQDEAIAELLRCSGTQFDPRVVRALIQLLGNTSLIVSKIPQTSPLPADPP